MLLSTATDHCHREVILRFALALLKQSEEALLACSSSNEAAREGMKHADEDDCEKRW